MRLASGNRGGFLMVQHGALNGSFNHKTPLRYSAVSRIFKPRAEDRSGKSPVVGVFDLNQLVVNAEKNGPRPGNRMEVFHRYLDGASPNVRNLHEVLKKKFGTVPCATYGPGMTRCHALFTELLGENNDFSACGILRILDAYAIANSPDLTQKSCLNNNGLMPQKIPLGRRICCRSASMVTSAASHTAMRNFEKESAREGRCRTVNKCHSPH